MSAAFLILLFSGLSLGQKTDSAPARESPGPYLNTSFEAVEKIAAAERLVENNQYTEAATAFQELADRFGDFLIPDDTGIYSNIRTRINHMICAWPKAALQSYRQIYEPPAQEALKRAISDEDVSQLLVVADRYFPTQAGARALSAAAQISMENGELTRAEQWYQRLLSSHPDRPSLNADWQAGALACQKWNRDRTHQDDWLNSQELTGVVHCQGRTWSWKEWQKNLLAESDQPMDSKQYSSPAVFSGGADRRGFFPTSALPEARLWRFAGDARATLEGMFDGYESQVARRDAITRALQSGRLLASVPVAASPDGRADIWLFVSDSSSATAIDPARPDKAVWRFEFRVGASTRQAMTTDDDTPPLNTCSVFDGRVYVPMERQRGQPGADDALIASTLVCLDAASGQEIWRNDLEALQSEFEETRLDGAPLLHEGKLFVVARKRKPFGFEACYLLRMNPRTGALESSVHVGEAATGSYGYHRATLTHAAACGELVFVSSNLGTIAAVNAFTSKLVWLRTYESKYTEAPEGLWPTRMGRPARSWHYQPAIAWDDALVVMPLDAEEVLIIGQSNGDLRQRIPLESLRLPEMMLGIDRERLYVVGSQIVCYDLVTRKTIWERAIDEGQVFGRGALTTNGVLVPTDQALLCYPLDGGLPRVHRWSIEDAGNLTVLPDQIVCASALSISGFMTKKDAFARLESRLVDNPDDPESALAMADLAFSTLELDRGLSAVRVALVRSEKHASPESKHRLFERLIGFAQFLMEQAGGDDATKKLNTAITLLQSAESCTKVPAEQVNRLLRLGQAYLRAREPVLAASHYQKILSNPDLRAAKVQVRIGMLPPPAADEEDVEDQGGSAGLVARRCLNRLISAFGSECYADIEKTAQAQLQGAISTHDVKALQDVADTYPNSRASASALINFGRWAAETGDYGAALIAYRGALRKKDVPERAGAIRAYIDALTAAGKTSLADQWLIRGIRDFPAFKFTRDKRTLGFADWRGQLMKDRELREPAHAITRSTAARLYKRLFTDRCNILDPVFSRLPDTRWENFISWSGDKLESRSAIDGRALWSRPYEINVQPALLGMDDARFVFATQHTIFALTRGSGQLAWEIGQQPQVDPTSDPESSTTWAHHAMDAGRLFSAADDGQLCAIDLSEGSVIWRIPARLPIGSQLTAGGKFVCFSAWEDNNHSIIVLDAQSGARHHVIHPNRDWPIQAMFLTPTGRLVVAMSSVIQAYDPDSGKLQWEINTPERFILSSLQYDDEGLIASGDGRHVSKYDLGNGELIWTSQALSAESGDNCWAEVSDGWLVVSANERLSVLDTADGRVLWTFNEPSSTRLEPPRIVNDAVVLVAEEKSKDKSKARANVPLAVEGVADAKGRSESQTESEHGRRLRLTVLDLQSGHPYRFGDSNYITTEPIESYSGLFLRDHAMLLLDGQRLIGLVGE